MQALSFNTNAPVRIAANAGGTGASSTRRHRHPDLVPRPKNATAAAAAAAKLSSRVYTADAVSFHAPAARGAAYATTAAPLKTGMKKNKTTTKTTTTTCSQTSTTTRADPERPKVDSAKVLTSTKKMGLAIVAASAVAAALATAVAPLTAVGEVS